jgi:hypothetical protein
MKVDSGRFRLLTDYLLGDILTVSNQEEEAQMTITAARAEYLSVAETAKLVRVALGKHFPSIKFSVRSRSYAGGASIDIHWTDGPRSKDVDRIAGGFEGASFDGMNDLKSYQSCWILPNGTAVLAERPDSYGGSIAGYWSDAPHPDARLVKFGADFVHCSREISDIETKRFEALKMIQATCHTEGLGVNEKFGNYWTQDLATNMVYDMAQGEPMENALRRVVFREDV